LRDFEIERFFDGVGDVKDDEEDDDDEEDAAAAAAAAEEEEEEEEDGEGEAALFLFLVDLFFICDVCG